MRIARPASHSGVASGAPAFLRRFRAWRRRRTELHELAALSDRELRDIGMNAYERAYALTEGTGGKADEDA
jgi:uncharacterized protein YjiS (DUF1127 family)